MRYANDRAHALGLCIALRVAKQTTYEDGSLVFLDIQEDQAIPGVTQIVVAEILVA